MPLRRQGWTISAIARHLPGPQDHPRLPTTSGSPGNASLPKLTRSEPLRDYVRARLERGPASVGGDVVRRGRFGPGYDRPIRRSPARSVRDCGRTG